MEARFSTHLAAAVVAASCLSGCVVTAAPIISEHDATFDARLVGTWGAEDSDEVATITRAEGPEYVIEYRAEDGERARFRALLGKLGDVMVLDVWPEPRDRDIPDVYAALLIPGHVVLAVEIAVGRITTAPIDPDALNRAIDEGEVTLPHTETDDQLILHGGTAELASAFAVLLAREGVLAEGGAWRRTSDPRGRGTVRR